jgi:Na+/H+ antiporter NhaD/arsenite permease-like protein
MLRFRGLLLAALCILPELSLAADIDGSALPLWWGIPFAGILLSIAVMPLVAPIFWHHHFGKVAAGWALLFLVPFAVAFGPGLAGASLVHALLAEYIPFVILLTALFTVAGGIYIKGNLHGSPGLNTGLLAIGAVLASFMGTTGASMLLIRPAAARQRQPQAQRACGGVLHFPRGQHRWRFPDAAIGDPPLFLGFLKGVDFFWTLEHMVLPVVMTSVPAGCVAGYLLHATAMVVLPQAKGQCEPRRSDAGHTVHRIFEVKFNFILLGVIVAAGADVRPVETFGIQFEHSWVRKWAAAKHRARPRS